MWLFLLLANKFNQVGLIKYTDDLWIGQNVNGAYLRLDSLQSNRLYIVGIGAGNLNLRKAWSGIYVVHRNPTASTSTFTQLYVHPYYVSSSAAITTLTIEGTTYDVFYAPANGWGSIGTVYELV